MVCGAVLAGCNPMAPQTVPLDGPWTFEVDIETIPLTWTMEADILGDSGTGHIVWYHDGEYGGEAWTAIRNILVDEDSVYFFEGGCDYLMRLRGPDRLEGTIKCTSYHGTVKGRRG